MKYFNERNSAAILSGLVGFILTPHLTLIFIIIIIIIIIILYIIIKDCPFSKIRILIFVTIK